MSLDANELVLLCIAVALQSTIKYAINCGYSSREALYLD